MGMVSVASRFGAASSPFVVQMTRINPILPFAIMGSLSFIAAVFCWILPETLGKRTAEVMDVSENEQGKQCNYKYLPFFDIHNISTSCRLNRWQFFSFSFALTWRLLKPFENSFWCFIYTWVLDQSIVLNVVVLLFLCSWESFTVPFIAGSFNKPLCFYLVLAELENQLTMAFNAETGSMHSCEPE